MITESKHHTASGWAFLLAGTLMASPAAFAADESWTKRINIGGVVEAEFGASEAYDGTKTSDVALSTVELGIEGKINNMVNAYVSFLYEEDDTAYDVDEGYISVALGAIHIQAGQMYIPFGSYETNVISDPLTLEIGETRESVFKIGAEIANISASVYVFNGSTQESGGDDVADQTGASIAYIYKGKGFSMDIGFDYLSNIGDSDTISGVVGTTLVSYVSGQVIHANLNFGNLNFIAEHLTTDKFDVSELSFKSKGAEIAASHIELAYTYNILRIESTLSYAMQTTEEALALGLPEEKSILCLSMSIYDGTSLGFEYATATDYAVADGGTGKDETSYTVQLSVEF